MYTTGIQFRLLADTFANIIVPAFGILGLMARRAEPSS